MKRILWLATGLVLLASFQNCSPVNTSTKPGESGPDFSGGEGYGGKTYRLVNEAGMCSDGSPYKGVIQVSPEKVARLTRDACAAVKDAPIVTVTEDATNPNLASYNGQVFHYDPPASDIQDCVTGAPAQVPEYGFSVASLSIGSFVANSLSPYLTNRTGVVFTVDFWNAPGSKYLRTDDCRNLVAQSNYCSRDMEIETYARNGMVFLRLSDQGNGYFVHLNQEGDALSIGAVTSFKEGVGFRYDTAGGDFNDRLDTLNMSTLIPGYDKDHTADHVFTYGIAGSEVYVKFKGREFMRWHDDRYMGVGRAALQAPDGYGFRDVRIRQGGAVK